MFDDLYKKLNKAQKLAVDTIDGPVMVVAGPGTGKTQILTLRIANILKQTQVGPENILALTFTEAGAKEMRRRLRTIIGNTADKVRIHTYHGFAASVIAEHNDHFPHLAGTKQLTETEAEVFIREILEEPDLARLRPLGNPDFYIPKIISTIGTAKKEAWTPEIIKSFAKTEIDRIRNDDSSISSRGARKGALKADALKQIDKCERTVLFADVYQKYEAKKKVKRKVDFDDLIGELLLALERDELLRQILQEKFQYLLIDEHQDTNDSQNMLVKIIADFFDEPNLFVVGDEKQAIYRFQGASVENFIKFQGIWKSMKVIPLEQNYRSHQNILDLVFPMIEHNYAPGQLENLRVKLRSDATEEAQPIDLVTAGNSEAADAYLVAKLKELQASKPEDKIAVIVRLNRDVRRVLSLLERNGLSAAAERGADLFAYPLGFLYFSLLEYLADPSRAESLAACVAGGLWDFNIETRASVIKDIKSGKLSEVHSRIPALSELRAQIARAGALEFLISAGQTSGITVLAAHDPLSAEVWRGIISLAEELVALGSPDDPKRIIQDLLLHRDSGNARGVKIHVGLPDSQISIMTAHGSKGLEFDYVFMPYATEESWMSRGHNSYFVLPRESDSEDEERDVRRLFYVALTRARKHISIIVPLQDGSDRLLTPVRFLSELGQAQLAKTDLPAVVVDVSARNGISQSKYDLESINYAKKVLTERGLSVTALNHFMKCPSEFFIKSILKLPEPPSTSAEKGNAMHLSMDKVWHLPVRDPEKIASCIEKTVKEYFADSLLLLVEKEAVVRELAAAAPVVAVALSQHFALQGAIATETWAERPLEFNPDIRIPLHGKLDAVVENAGEVLVFDYKTQEAMSVNAIKGETKNDDGNYFRQLVFYKIILSDKFKNKKIQPALVFIKPDAKGRCPIISLPVEESDISRVKGEIQQLVDSVWSGNFLKEKCDDEDCRYCAMRTAMS